MEEFYWVLTGSSTSTTQHGRCLAPGVILLVRIPVLTQIRRPYRSLTCKRVSLLAIFSYWCFSLVHIMSSYAHVSCPILETLADSASCRKMLTGSELQLQVTIELQIINLYMTGQIQKLWDNKAYWPRIHIRMVILYNISVSIYGYSYTIGTLYHTSYCMWDMGHVGHKVCM